ncbi:hypothetical protein F0562_026584 [Nyssa sinensis]|uniref:Bifunctional inhibitor/plant lipid transfer protein/seed storage helical domain-containing protein n=1 Tax=Nyssa sinensis TaxID=561372 RepID=A0A5J5BDC4_9ASTE|nr:hypothetical protein F0562_026584 [Nyssa sinensis]
MAASKSLVSLSSQATSLLVLVALLALTRVSQSQTSSCSAELSSLNVCQPFMVPGAPNTNPSPECCGALQAVEHDCICNTIRIAARLPAQCNIPPLTCNVN